MLILFSARYHQIVLLQLNDCQDADVQYEMEQNNAACKSILCLKILMNGILTKIKFERNKGDSDAELHNFTVSRFI